MNELAPKALELIYYLLETKTRKVSVVVAVAASIVAIRKLLSNPAVKIDVVVDKNEKKIVKGNVDKYFLRNIIKLLKICIPKLFSRETFSLGLMTGSMIFRTLLSVYMSEITSQIVKSIVKRDLTDFLINISILGGLALPGSFSNSLIDYLNKKISIYFRENLTNHFQDTFLKDMCYYKMTYLDSRVQNPDEIFTTEIEKFSGIISTLYYNFSKPMMDIIFFSLKLSKTLGWSGPGILAIWYLLSGMVMKLITPSFGKLSAIETTLEGKFRANHKKIITHSEEIAFYNGNIWELNKINESFKLLTRHLKDVAVKKFFMGIFDAMLTKFGATIVGTIILGLPVFSGKFAKYNQNNKDSSAAEITKDYIQNSGLLLNFAKAIGKIILTYKDLQILAGSTGIVNELSQVIDDVHNGKWERKQLNEDIIKKYVPGVIEDSSFIEFNDIPIITPTGEILAEHVNFKVSFNFL